jgi:hypothetical protein
LRPSNYVIQYRKEWIAGNGSKEGWWSILTELKTVPDAIAEEKRDLNTDTASDERKTTVRYYPLANKDGSLNKDMLFGTSQMNSESIARYGEVQVQFKPSTLKNMTITPGDSVDWGRDPLPATLAMKGDSRLPMIDWARINPKTKEVGLNINEYIEAQWWKTPTPSDISKVIFTGKAPTPEVKQLLDEQKVPYQVLGADKPITPLKPSQFRKIYGEG